MITWAMDIETEDWDIPVLGRAVSSEGHTVAWDGHEGMWDWYASLDKSDLVIAHNGGRYDFLALIDSNPDVPWKGTMAGSGLVSLRAEGGAECRDSYRLFPMGLAEWTGAKIATGAECERSRPQCLETPEGCGGFCAIRRDMDPLTRRRVGDYCENDCRILLEAWERGIGRLELEGFEVRDKNGRLRRTIGSVAYATMIRECDLPSVGLDWATYDRGLRGYYGGNCQCAYTGPRDGTPAPEAESWDITQAYPWALCQPVPDGEPEWVNRSDDALRAFVAQKPGIYSATIRVPTGRWPLLPHRSPKGRLLWATGELVGDWTGLELEWAIEHGAHLRGIQRALVYPAERAKYVHYMRGFVFPLRDAAKRKHVELAEAAGEHPDDMWSEEKAHATEIKFAGNAPSGKLAQSPGVARLVIGDVPRAEERKGQWDPLGARAWMQTMRPEPPTCARPAEAAYMTSRVRCRLGEALLAIDGWYCDTDGVKGRGTMPADLVGKDLGLYKHEGPVRSWRSRGPKLYDYRTHPTPKNPTGRVVRMKGFPRADEHTYERAMAGQAIPIDRGVKGIRSALRDDDRAFKRKAFERTIRADPRVAGSRLIGPDGYTTPLHRDETGEYSWPVKGAPDPEEILKISRRKLTNVWQLFFGGKA